MDLSPHLMNGRPIGLERIDADHAFARIARESGEAVISGGADAIKGQAKPTEDEGRPPGAARHGKRKRAGTFHAIDRLREGFSPDLRFAAESQNGSGHFSM
ncbi:hypothetical protein [Burkholderia glumae]|uniref:hypothetical protein n=1 Tax=Burkholderia glumae TaxID=337 RepID=UPI003B9B18E8